MAGIKFVLRPFREDAGLSRRELAKLIGVDHTTIWSLEKGKSRRIDFDVLNRLCTVFSKKLGRRVRVEDLLQRTADKQSKLEQKSRSKVRKHLKERGGETEHHLTNAVNASERGDRWTALSHAIDAGAADHPLTERPT